MKVDYSIFSLNNYHPQNANTLMGYRIESPMTKLALISIPGTFSFFVSIHLTGEFRINESHFLEFIITKDDDIVFETGELPFVITGADFDDRIPTNQQSKFLSFKITDLPFRVEGLHEYLIRVDSKDLKTDSFYVFPIQKELSFWRDDL